MSPSLLGPSPFLQPRAFSPLVSLCYASVIVSSLPQSLSCPLPLSLFIISYLSVQDLSQ